MKKYPRITQNNCCTLIIVVVVFIIGMLIVFFPKESTVTPGKPTAIIPEEPKLSKMASPHGRRNHGCVVSDIDNEAILIAGRWSPNIEVLDLKTNTHRIVVNDTTLLDLNHLSQEIVPSLKNANEEEIWVMCGFKGDLTNSEVGIDHVVIIEKKNWNVRLGPKLKSLLGGCTSAKFDGPCDGNITYDSLFSPPNSDSINTHSTRRSKCIIKSRLVCSIGGFVGKHDKGYSLNNFTCYDRLNEIWIDFPNLPISLDHHNTVVFSRSECNKQKENTKSNNDLSIQPSEDQTNQLSVVVSNGRTGAYGPTNEKIFELKLGERNWTSFPNPFNISAAQQMITSSGIIITVGGVWHLPKFSDSGRITLYDVCQKKVCKKTKYLLKKKYALANGCYHENLKRLIVCGGTGKFYNLNSNTCEYFNVNYLMNNSCGI